MQSDEEGMGPFSATASALGSVLLVVEEAEQDCHNALLLF
jgi:hypothetical protein